MNAIRAVSSMAIDWPLETVSHPSSVVAKIVAAAVMAIFTVFSLGYYVVYASRYFANKRFERLIPQLESAVTSNDLAKARELFAADPKLKEVLNGYEGRTPNLLYLAVDHQHPEMIDFLIHHGADLNAQGRMGTPLAVAVYQGRLNMVQYLLQKKADPNLGDGHRTPITLAALECPAPACFDIMNLLIRNQANVSGTRLLPAVALYYWNTYPERTRETLTLLMQHGATLGSNDDIENQEALQFIRNNR